MFKTLGKLGPKDRGQAVTEYAVILAVVLLVVAGSLGAFAVWLKSQ